MSPSPPSNVPSTPPAEAGGAGDPLRAQARGIIVPSPPPQDTERGTTPPPNTPRRARSVSVTNGVIEAAAARIARLENVPPPRSEPESPAECQDTEELEYIDVPPGFVWPSARPPSNLPAATTDVAAVTRSPLANPGDRPTGPLGMRFVPETPPSRPTGELSNTEPDRRSRKRARLESVSPTPPGQARGGRLQRTAFSMRARHATTASPPLAPIEWRRPTARVDRPAWVAPEDVDTTPRRLPDTQQWTHARTSSREAPPPVTMSQPIPIAGAARPARANTENTPPEDLMFDIDLDLPLMHPPANGRTPSEAGLPLSVLDFNRNRFPTAIAPSGPINPEAFEAAWPGSAVAATRSTTLVPSTGSVWPPDTTGSMTRITGTGANRPPTPYPFPLAAAATAPPTPFGSLAVSFRMPAALPDFPHPPADGRSLSRTATYTAGEHGPVPPSLPTGPSFTPTPEGGFPDVVSNEPDGLLVGLPRARVAALVDPATGVSVGVRVWNSGFPAPRDVRPLSAAITETVQSVTGELSFLLVPPEVEWAVPPERRPEPPITWIILGLSGQAVSWLVAQRVVSTPAVTLFFYRPAASVPRFLFLAGGFAHDHDNSVMHAIWSVFSGPRVLPGILSLAQSNPAFVGVRPEDVARTILGSLEVRVTTLRNGNIIAAIFCDSPTSSPPRWREWRDSVARLPFPSPFNSTGFARRAGRCHGCHGADHPTYLCPFQDVPGWNAPPPGAHWGQAGTTQPDGSVNNDAPPGPPPPPSGQRGRHPPRGGSYPRGGLGKRDRRDCSGGSMGPASGSNAAPPLF